MTAVLEISEREKLYKKYPELYSNLLTLICEEYQAGKIQHKHKNMEEMLYQCFVAVVDVLYK